MDIDTVFAGLNFAMAYLDDILIKSENKTEYTNMISNKRVENVNFVSQK